MTIPSTTPPGWYPDPYAPGRRRWWDGVRWTVHAAPAPPVFVPDKVNHVLHLLLTVFTFGLWAPVWLFVGWMEGRRRADAMRRVHGLTVS